MLAALAVLLLAFGLRLYRLGAQSLWYDETVSVYLAGESVPALVEHTARDIHPPGYYLLLHAWTRLAGDSEFSAAYLSLFFGLLLAALAYCLGRWAFSQQAGLAAVLLVAVSPYNLWYSQEVRMYTLGAVLGVGVLAAALSLPAGRLPGWRRLAVYTVCAASGLWVLYYFSFLLLAVNLMVLAVWLGLRRRGRAGWPWLGRWALAQGVVVLLYAPWLPIAWKQVTEPPVPPWRGLTSLGTIVVETWSALSLGQSARPAGVWPALVLMAGLFLLGLTVFGRPRRSPRDQAAVPWFLAGYVFVPVLLMFLASFITPLYHVRYIFPYSPPFYLLVGAGLARLWRRWPAVGAAVLAVVLAFSGLSIHAMHTDTELASDDHRAAAQFLSSRWRPGDAVLIDAGYVYTAVVTYWQGDPIAWRGRLVDPSQPDLPIPGGGPALFEAGSVDGSQSLGWGNPEADFYPMSREDTAEALARLFAAYDRVWVYRCYDTVTDPDGFIRAWLDDHGTPFEDQVFTGVSQLRVQGWLTGREPQAPEWGAGGAVLADGTLRLTAAETASPSVPVGGALDLALVWQVESPVASERILFAGLFDAEGERWAQADERPLGSLYPVAAWPQGATVRTPVRVPVPAGTPPGRYRLEVGWYHFVDGQPMWLPFLPEPASDRLLLAEGVEVVPPGDWGALPAPPLVESIGLEAGDEIRLLGLGAVSPVGSPGKALSVELVWQALKDGPEVGTAVLSLADDAGHVVAEAAAEPLGGRVPFAHLAAGQTLKDRRSLLLPAQVPPGVYNLSVVCRDPAGKELPYHRGPLPAGHQAPLATIRVE